MILNRFWKKNFSKIFWNCRFFCHFWPKIMFLAIFEFFWAEIKKTPFGGLVRLFITVILSYLPCLYDLRCGWGSKSHKFAPNSFFTQCKRRLVPLTYVRSSISLINGGFFKYFQPKKNFCPRICFAGRLEYFIAKNLSYQPLLLII